MARSLSNVKTLSSFIANQISTTITRRGYCAASQGMTTNGAKAVAPNAVVKKGSGKTAEVAWVPDPVSGYYRPESQVKDVDPVEMRKMVIRSKTRAK